MMLSKDNMDILYVLLIVFVVYILIFRVKETLENVDLSNMTEEQLRLLINKSIRSKEQFEYLKNMENPTEYFKKRIGELYQDIQNGERAKETLINRGIFT